MIKRFNTAGLNVVDAEFSPIRPWREIEEDLNYNLSRCQKQPELKNKTIKAILVPRHEAKYFGESWGGHPIKVHDGCIDIEFNPD